MSDAVLSARGISRSYGSFEALRELSIEARAGEVIGLLGPNGAGKTTAFRVLTTILRPTAGAFTLRGIPHTQPADIHRQLGVLPESAGYPEQQTGHEYLTYYARLFGQPAARARASAAALLDEVGLGAESIHAHCRLQPRDAPAARRGPRATQQPGPGRSSTSRR